MRENTDVTEQEAIDIIAGNIRARRGLLRWSQGDLAEKVGTTQNMVSRWEAGQAEITSGSLVRLANAFEVDVTDLFIPFDTPAQRRAADSRASYSTGGQVPKRHSPRKKAAAGKKRAA